ncbi:MAG: glycosyltransferase family 39 protein [Vulcanimicrobiaceae bacterium]
MAAFATLPGLGTGTLWDNSETAYGEVAREILLSNDAIVMHLNGAAWYVQPPLYFWIAALFAKWLGVTEFALRLPAALATIAMSAGVGYAVTRVASGRAAFLAATILATALMQAVLGRLAVMDALLDLAVMVGILGWFGALRTGSARSWYGAWIALALGTLTKGPVALALALLVVVPWAIWVWRDGERLVWPSPIRWLAGIVVYVSLLAPWAIALERAAGPIAFGELLLHYTVGRYLGTIENQSGPLWYYVPVVILGFFPWFAFLVPAAVGAVREARGGGMRYGGFAIARAMRPGDRRSFSREPDTGLSRLALIWAIVPFLFFSLAKTKLPNYVALELPACAMLVAMWFDRVVERVDRRSALAWAAVVPVTIGGIAFAIWAFSHDNRLTLDVQAVRSSLFALGFVMLGGSLACFGLLLLRRLAWLAPFALAVSGALVVAIIGVVGEPLVERFKPIPALARAIERERRPGDVVAIQSVSGGNALVFYTHPRVVTLDAPSEGSSSDTDPRRTICTAPRAFVVTSTRRPSADPTYGRSRREIARSNNDVLFLYDGPPCSARAAGGRRPATANGSKTAPRH